MTTTLTTTGAKKLKINKLTKTQLASATLSNTEMYLVDPEFTGDKLLVTDSNGDITESTLLAPSKWIAKNAAVYNGALGNTGNPQVYNWSSSLASYLPNDGAQYEILCEEYADGAVNVRINTDFASDLSAFYNSGTNAMVRNMTLIVGAGRTLQLRSYTAVNSYWLTFIAYRKVG